MKKLKVWMQNARKASLAQSMLPAILAVVIAINEAEFNIFLAILAVLGVVSAHLGMNLADDFFDYKVNTAESRKELSRQGIRARIVKYPYLTSNESTLQDLKKAIVLFLLFAAIMGGIILTVRFNWLIVLIAFLTLFLGISYSGFPFKFSYIGLGELVIGIIFGPLLMMGVYIASANRLDSSVVLASIPVGLLVVNILFTHSFIDKKADESANKMTFARLLKTNKANLTASVLFNFIPYLIIVAGVVLKYLHPLYLLIFLVLPRSIWLIKSLFDFAKSENANVAKPPKYMGNMGNWEKFQKAGIDWFMARWLAARNILSLFCIVIIIINIILWLSKCFI
ncbi:MAG: prenyltransferase [Bacteroidales bacterium]|jgi:1,4-dihydroxy-2-naphthoate octaprenyltransferase|nr:prenyltransferase [Bacteroidales bacterium]MBQ5873021.1 prenyltransferase [Bacteroidales bacterium]